jgi:hypothetical protein
LYVIPLLGAGSVAFIVNARVRLQYGVGVFIPLIVGVYGSMNVFIVVLTGVAPAVRQQSTLIVLDPGGRETVRENDWLLVKVGPSIVVVPSFAWQYAWWFVVKLSGYSVLPCCVGAVFVIVSGVVSVGTVIVALPVLVFAGCALSLTSQHIPVVVSNVCWYPIV